MHREPSNYKDYFHPGQRARVEMSLQGDRVFNDGAVVTAVGDSKIVLRLSRGDRLPAGIMLHSEAPLVVRVGASGNGYSCRGVVLSEPFGEDLQVGFVGQVTAEDLREYFRLNAEIPVTLFNVTAGNAEESGSGGLRVVAQARLPRIVNISGGGLRTETEMTMSLDDIIYASFQLPLPEPKIIPVVTQVVYSEVIERSGVSCVSAGLRYMHINERDRDAIVRYVCNEEIRMIRMRRKDFFSLPERRS